MVWDWLLGWLGGKLLDKLKDILLGTKNKNEEIIRIFDERLKEKEKTINQLLTEKDTLKNTLEKDEQKHEQERYKIIESLKRRGISVDKFVERYDKPLNAILISYAAQKEEVRTGSYGECHYLKDELSRYNSKYLGGTDVLIPPSKVPTSIKTQIDLMSWFENDIRKGRFCKLKFLVLFDLKKKSIWGTFLPYEQKKPLHRSIGEVLSIEDLFTEEEINRIPISEIIRGGDLGWLASSVLANEELDILHRNQYFIEKALGNPCLRELANEEIKVQLTDVLSKYYPHADEISKAIIEEAKFWENKLK